MTEQLTSRIEYTKRLYLALVSGDKAALGVLLSPGFIGRGTEGLPMGLGGTYRGPQEMIEKFWWRIGAAFKASPEADSFDSAGENKLLVSGRYRGFCRATGRALDAEFVHILEFDGELIVGLRQITDSSAWCAAYEGAEAATVPEYSGIQLADLETIEYSVENKVARVILDRPDSRNAINLRMADETLVVARAIAADPAVRSVLIAGNGPALTVGGDVDFFTAAESGTLGALTSRMIDPYHQAFKILEGLTIPIVTAAHGSVAGGGLGFLYAADIVLAAEGTIFATGFSRLGLSGDGGGTWHLPRIIGATRARQMYIQNLRIDADRAEQWGLVSEVVPADEIRQRAEQLAISLADGPTSAYGQMRTLLNDSWDNTLSEQLDAEQQGLEFTGGTKDADAAVSAFISKTRPTFEGR